MIKEKANIYVDIESLLDIRQGILHELMDEEELVKFINSDEYNFREIDEFPVDMSRYKELLEEKSIELLKYSTLTYIIAVLNNKVANLEKRNIYYGEKRSPQILFNIYPFKLDKAIIDDMQNYIFIKTNRSAFVEIISIPNKELTPYFIKSSNIVASFIYNFSEWFNHHGDALRETKLNDNLLYFPSLYSKRGSDEEIKYIKSIGFKDIFSYIEFLTAEYANISFLPVVFYTNLVTAELYIREFNSALKKKDLSKEKDNGNISAKV